MVDKTILDADLIQRLIEIRARMVQRFQEHTAGDKLPPEQSLDLRSHISNITRMIAPSTQEMWPDFSPEEKAYMASEAATKHKDANHLAMLALGPLAIPAKILEDVGAPPDAVSSFIELGFNLAAASKVTEAGLRNVGKVQHEPVYEHVKVQHVVPKAADIPLPTEPASNMRYFDVNPVTRLEDYHGPRVTMRRVADQSLSVAKEAESILSWLKTPEVEKLGLAISHYSGGRGQLLANLKAEANGGKITDDILQEYQHSPEGRSSAYRDAYAFERRFVQDIVNQDISNNVELDPTRLQLMLGRLQGGQYVTARDYAALEQVRQLAHETFVEGRVKDYVSMAQHVHLEGEALQKGADHVRSMVEAISPYIEPKAEGRHPPAAGPSVADPSADPSSER